VASRLNLSPYTVVSLSQRIYEKLGIRTRAELTRIMLMRI
jgi:DNA-binding CsgD family transcriptional regulator